MAEAIDPRYTAITEEKSAAITAADQQFSDLIGQQNVYTDQQQKLIDEWSKQQQAATQQQTDFAVGTIEQQKGVLSKDYTKEATGAYSDYAKTQSAYNATAEQQAMQGLAGSGYSESAKVQQYTAYQNRISLAKEAYTKAVVNYDNSIKEALLLNNTKLAEIAYSQLEKSLDAAITAFQYKSDLTKYGMEYKQNIENTYYGRWQDVQAQINAEAALKESIRQWEAEMAYKKQQDAIAQEQWRQEFEASKYSSSGGTTGSGITLSGVDRNGNGVDDAFDGYQEDFAFTSGAVSSNDVDWYEGSGLGMYNGQLVTLDASGNVVATTVADYNAAQDARNKASEAAVKKSKLNKFWRAI